MSLADRSLLETVRRTVSSLEGLARRRHAWQGAGLLDETATVVLQGGTVPLAQETVGHGDLEERAAIIEYDGRLPRLQAKRLANSRSPQVSYGEIMDSVTGGSLPTEDDLIEAARIWLIRWNETA